MNFHAKSICLQAMMMSAALWAFGAQSQVVTGAPGSTIQFGLASQTGVSELQSDAAVTVNSSGTLTSATLSFNTQFDTGPLDNLSTCGPVSCETYQAGPATIISVAGSGATILSAVVNTFEIFANSGASSAVIELNMTCTVSGIVSLSGCVLPESHLILSGSTNNPVPVNSVLTPQGTVQSYGAFNVDWTGTLSATPYSPSAVPEPGQWVLMLLGLCVLVGLVRWRARLDGASPA